jgi:hypothetical protein
MRRIAIVALAALLGATAAQAAGKSATARRMALPDVTGTVPAGWTTVPRGGMSARFRLAQYRLPRAAGDPVDPEVIVYYFGPGGGGTVPANLERWKGQFESPAGQAAKTTERTRDGLRITTIDLHGTYKERATPMSASFTPRANYRMLAAAVETTRPGGQGPYWIRLVGPAKSVAAQKSAWDSFLASLRPK